LPTRGLDDSRTGHLADWSTHGRDKSRVGQVADWTTHGCHRRLCMLSFRSFGGICETASWPVCKTSSPRVGNQWVGVSASCLVTVKAYRCVPGELGSPSSPLILFLHLFEKRSSVDKCHGFIYEPVMSNQWTTLAVDPDQRKSPTYLIRRCCCLHCFDTVGWAAGRAYRM